MASPNPTPAQIAAAIRAGTMPPYRVQLPTPAEMQALGHFVATGQEPAVTVPPSITGTWDSYTVVIGQTVPANLQRAARALRAIPRAG